MRRRSGTKHWTASEAGALLEQWRRSGQSLGAWCAAHGLRYERLRRWRVKLEGGGPGDTGCAVQPVELREVRVVDSGADGELWIDLRSGTHLRLRGALDPEQVARLIRALESA